MLTAPRQIIMLGFVCTCLAAIALPASAGDPGEPIGPANEPTFLRQAVQVAVEVMGGGRDQDAQANDADDADDAEPGIKAIADLDEALRQARGDDQADALDADGELGEFLRVSIQSINLTRSIAFQEDGRANDPSHRLNISLRLHWDPEHIRPITYRQPRLTEAVSDGGEDLTGDARVHDHEQRVWHHRHHQQGWPTFNLSMQLGYPTLAATQLQRVRATVPMKIARGPVRYVVLAPVAEIEGRQIRVEGIDDGSYIRVNRPNENQLQIVLTDQLMQLANEDAMRLLGDDGRELNTRGGGSSSSGNRMTRTHHVNMGDEGRIILAFFSSVEEIDLPIELSGVPIPPPPQFEGGLALAPLHVQMQDEVDEP